MAKKSVTRDTRSAIRSENDERAAASGYWYDPSAAARVLGFIVDNCRHSQGQWAGEPFVPLDWQTELLCRVYGWMRPDGSRRFRSVYLEVAKKNGKSTLLSALSLYHLIGDRESVASVYICACDRAQASIIFDEAARMVKQNPELADRLDLVEYRKHLIDEATFSRIEIVSRESNIDAKDGVNASCVIFDELHRQPDDRLPNLFRYSGRSRRQPLRWEITTAGKDRHGLWKTQRDYTEGVESGKIRDLHHTGAVYRADPSDPIDDPATWRKANPSLGVLLTEEGIADDLAEALAKPRLMPDFKRLTLNVLSHEATKYIGAQDWDAVQAALPEVFPARPCFAGLDLSSTQDLTALALVWTPTAEHPKYSARVYFWSPADTARERAERDHVPYLQWGVDGFVTLTPGPRVDYAEIRKTVNDLHSLHRVQALHFDPAFSTQLINELADLDGLPCVEHRQGFIQMSDPVKSLEALVKRRAIEIDHNPALDWCAENAATENRGELVRLSKEHSTDRIDGLVALVMALAAAQNPPKTASMVSAYETDSLVFAS